MAKILCLVVKLDLLEQLVWGFILVVWAMISLIDNKNLNLASWAILEKGKKIGRFVKSDTQIQI